jgi:hypothetical protein
LKELTEMASDSQKLSGFYKGLVVDTMDPLQRNRIKCHVIGLMEPSESIWVEQVTSIFGGSKTLSGINSTPKKDSIVWLFFDGGNPLYPHYFGYLRGGGDTSIYAIVEDKSQEKSDPGQWKNESDEASEAKQLPEVEALEFELEELHSKATYPLNNVISTESGFFYIDDSQGNERVGFQHKTGTMIEVRPNGDLTIKTLNDSYFLTKNNNKRLVGGTEDIHVVKDHTEIRDAKSTSTLKGDTKIQVTEGKVDLLVDKGDTTIDLKGKKTETVAKEVSETYKNTKSETVTGKVTETYNNTKNETVAGKVTETFKAGQETTVTGVHNISATTSATVTSPKTTIEGTSEAALNSSSKVSISGGGQVKITGGRIQLN